MQTPDMIGMGMGYEDTVYFLAVSAQSGQIFSNPHFRTGNARINEMHLFTQQEVQIHSALNVSGDIEDNLQAVQAIRYPHDGLPCYSARPSALPAQSAQSPSSTSTCA